MQKLVLSILCFSLIILAAFSLRHAQPQGDWQLWKVVSVEKKMDDSLRLNLEEETRWSEDMNRFMHQSLDIGLLYGVIEIELFYLWQSLKSLGKWKSVNVLNTQINFIF